ncbi:MAG: tetratricopeptide repeat protein [Myxococcota bacterium]|nr:tetratricopeptide repeat protein [Myxococcota bacterium]
MANDDEKRSPDDAEDEREAPEGEEDEQDSHEGDDEGDESESEEGSDESDGEEDEDEGDEPEAAAGSAAAAAAAAKKKTGRKHKASGKISAGQRLAAAKAAKAAKKIAQRGKEAEVVEEQAVETATVASTWLDRNRNKLLGAFAAVLLLGGAFFGIRAMQQKSAAEASQLLWEATEILNASIEAPGDDEDTAEDAVDAQADEDEVTYETIAARADAALAKLDELFASHGDSPAAAWGRLEEGRARYQKGEHAEARTAFEAALAQGGEALAPRALEGIAFTYEAEENWDEAVARFEQLREEGGALQILADYHLARIHLAKNEEDPAKTKLQAVLEALREEGAPELAYVRDQAELRLMAIDSSLVQRDAAGQMDPAEMQRLIEQLTRQQQQQGGAP